MLKTFFSALAAFAVVFVSGVQVQGQEISQSESKNETTVALDADGNFVGNVFADVGGEKKPVEAKMTLIREGVKVKTVVADEDGSFSFGEVPPGKYKVTGAAASYVGMSPVVVAPSAAPVQESNNFILSSPSYTSGSVMSYSPAYSGGGGGGGFVGGGRVLGNRRLLRLGLIGGIVAIAVGDDSSPDQ